MCTIDQLSLINNRILKAGIVQWSLKGRKFTNLILAIGPKNFKTVIHKGKKKIPSFNFLAISNSGDFFCSLIRHCNDSGHIMKIPFEINLPLSKANFFYNNHL